MRVKSTMYNKDTILAAVVKSESSMPDTKPSLECQESISLAQDQRNLMQERIKDTIHYRELRKTYAWRVFLFICCWSVAVLLILLSKGFFSSYFELSDIVLTTLVGGTTVSVVGLVGFMMQGLFHSYGSKKE